MIWPFAVFHLEFREGSSSILVATDVASRGLGEFKASYCTVSSLFLSLLVCLSL